MIIEKFDREKRSLPTVSIDCDLAIVGGGMSGVCAAIAAARAGIKVVLVQDRPVLGGNASSEVRLWILGATSHMGNNNRWSREGGIINEILVENVYRNPEGNPIIFDTIILEKVKNESNITLLLNTAVYDIEKNSADTISKVFAFCSQNQLFYDVSSKLFCDASGDGLIAYRAGASYRMGAEDKIEFNEKFAPDHGEYGELLGHSIYFYSKDTGKPVKFVAPAYALKDIENKIPRFGNINSAQHGCKFWWLEYGGRLDTIYDTEEIKWELWSIVYGIWDYIKNSGKFDADTLTLEWVGVIPGKRESRRFLGHYTLTQDDIVKQNHFDDAIAFGGWAIDLHPADGVYSKNGGCIQYHSKGVYEIPYRCFISKEIKNLYYVGRGISATHVAHGSSRVMATSAFGGQAVGIAAAQCIKKNLYPADLVEPKEMKELQESLNIIGQSIPKTFITQKTNLADCARIEASSTLQLSQIPFDGPWCKLDFSAAQLLPLEKDVQYTFDIQVEALKPTTLTVELRCAEKAENYTPDIVLDRQMVNIQAGEQTIKVQFQKGVSHNQYVFLTFMKNDDVKIRMSNERYTGIVSVFNKFNLDVNNHGKQIPPENSGIDAFEFWCPDRRPKGHNIAMNISPSIHAYSVSNLTNGYTRPSTGTNAWAASLSEKSAILSLQWDKPQTVKNIILYFDTDFDHPMESVQMGHPENIMPFCVRNYIVKDDKDNIIAEVEGNHQTIGKINLQTALITKGLTIELENPSGRVPASLFQIVVKE